MLLYLKTANKKKSVSFTDFSGVMYNLKFWTGKDDSNLANNQVTAKNYMDNQHEWQ